MYSGFLEGVIPTKGDLLSEWAVTLLTKSRFLAPLVMTILLDDGIVPCAQRHSSQSLRHRYEMYRPRRRLDHLSRLRAGLDESKLVVNLRQLGS